MTYPNSPIALIKDYSGCWSCTSILIVFKPLTLWSSQLEMSVIKILCNSLPQEMGVLGSVFTAPENSWEKLRGWRVGALSFSLFFIYLPSLHNSASEESRGKQKCLPMSLSVSCFSEGCVHLLYNIAVPSLLHEWLQNNLNVSGSKSDNRTFSEFCSQMHLISH